MTRATRSWESYKCFFFFQAEDGIRDLTVTGVQTCALPISCNTSATGKFSGSARFGNALCADVGAIMRACKMNFTHGLVRLANRLLKIFAHRRDARHSSAARHDGIAVPLGSAVKDGDIGQRMDLAQSFDFLSAFVASRIPARSHHHARAH